MILGAHHYYFSCPEDGRGAARRFYVDLLGMRESRPAPELEDEALVWFYGGDFSLHVRFCADAEQVTPRRHIALVTDEADALRNRLEADGFATDDAVVLPGQFRFYANDPFGNRIEFVEKTLG